MGDAITLRNVEPNDGFWYSCSGCHETNEGVETGWYSYSEIFGCYVGAGCRECGGLGVIWDNTDYSDMANFMVEEDQALDRLAALEAERDRYKAALDTIGEMRTGQFDSAEDLFFEARGIARAALSTDGGER